MTEQEQRLRAALHEVVRYFGLAPGIESELRDAIDVAIHQSGLTLCGKDEVCVPVEPSPEMSAFNVTGVHFPIAERIYKAMIQAAQQPSSEETE